MDLKQLEKLYELKQKGIISDSEFLSEKNKILSSDNETNQEHHKKTSDKSMFDYWLSCMGEKYCCFTGEATRLEYWCFVLVDFLFSLPIFILFSIAELTFSFDTMLISIIILLVWFLITLLPRISLRVRRFHNLKMSGWWMLVWLPFCPAQSAPFLKGTGEDRTNACILWSFLFPPACLIIIAVIAAIFGAAIFGPAMLFYS